MLNTVVKDDIRFAADIYLALVEKTKPFKAAFLGGAFLSWASGVSAKDWDIFLLRGGQTESILENLGYKFTDKMQQPRYSQHTAGENCLISENTIYGSEQIILSDRDLGGIQRPIHLRFDYLHCMIGVESSPLHPSLSQSLKLHEAVRVGYTPTAYGWLITNPNAQKPRSAHCIKKKLAGKSIWNKEDITLYQLEEVLVYFLAQLKGPSEPVMEQQVTSADVVLETAPAPMPALVSKKGLCYHCGDRTLIHYKNNLPICDDCD